MQALYLHVSRGDHLQKPIMDIVGQPLPLLFLSVEQSPGQVFPLCQQAIPLLFGDPPLLNLQRQVVVPFGQLHRPVTYRDV